MNEIIERLPKNLFCRIRKCYIIATQRIKAFDNNRVYLFAPGTVKKGPAETKVLPLSPHYVKNLRDSINYLPSYTGRKPNAVKTAELLEDLRIE